MEIYEVIYKNESARCKEYGSDYYDVDGKMAYRVVIEENTYKTTVMAKNVEAVQNLYKEETYDCGNHTERKTYDVEIKHLRSEENQFEALYPVDQVSTVEKMKRIDTKDLREEDAFCSEEVQKRYERADEASKRYLLTYREQMDY